MRKILAMILLAVGVLVAVPVGVGAANLLNPICDSADKTISDEQREAAGCGNTTGELESKIPTAVSAILWIAGVLAVGMIIYAGVRMIISQGDAGKVAQERQTIVYAVVGLIVTLLAYVIVGFVVGEFNKGGGDAEEDGGDNGLVEGDA